MAIGIRPDPFGNFEANRFDPTLTPRVGGLPIQSAETASRRRILPPSFATLRDFLTAGIPNLTAGSRTTAKLDELNADPLGSTLFKNTITPLLASLVPSETAARRSLADRFRQTGQTQSGAFAEQARLQESDILGNRNELVARHAGDIYSRLLQSLGLGLNAEQLAAQPFQLGTTLLNALDEGEDVTGGRFSTFDPIATAAAGRGGGGSFGGGGGGIPGNPNPLGIDPRTGRQFGFERGQISPPGSGLSTQGPPPVSYIPPSTDDPYFPGFGYGFEGPQIPLSYSQDLGRAYA